jgi:N-acetylneuraminic acid mutarotase
MKSNNTDQNRDSVLKCDSHGMPKLPGTSQWMPMIYVNGYIFTCGGSTYSKDCHKINLVTKKVEAMKPMTSTRTSFYMAHYNNKVYAIGGEGVGGEGGVGDEWMSRNTVEEYDIASDTWTAYSHSLPIEKNFRGCSVQIDNLVYVIGGTDTNWAGMLFKCF